MLWPAHRRRKTRCERGRAFLPSHYLLLALSLPLSTFPSLFLLSPQSATRRTIRPLRVYPLSLSYTCNLTFPSFYSASRPVIVDTTVQNGCFTPPLARELGNKLAAGLISLSRLDTATLPLETSRDRCPKPSNRWTRFQPCPEDLRINGCSRSLFYRLFVSLDTTWYLLRIGERVFVRRLPRFRLRWCSMGPVSSYGVLYRKSCRLVPCSIPIATRVLLLSMLISKRLFGKRWG